MPMIPYLVSQFAQPTMTNLVRECFGYDFPDILTKRQVSYIYNYLRRLMRLKNGDVPEGKEGSVLLEFDYVDKDFLEDFSRYYAKRYGNDGHKCARMHFFSSTIDHLTVSTALAGGVDGERLAKDLAENYLGFMVIKPLPKTFIGKTCLKVMPDEETSGKRKFRLSREYKVDLFGMELSVNSIAFQEQDKVVAACATTAIWSSLHALTWHSTRSVHSCSEITMNALDDRNGSSNSFPNSELNTEQMLRSVDAEGLRHHQESLREADEARFFETVVSHIDSKLPLIFVGAVYSIKGKRQNRLAHEGNHAICILGYKRDEEKVLYIHDDRLGPYVRAKLVTATGYGGDRPRESWAIGLQTMNPDGTWSDPTELIVPDMLVVPTDKKVRLPFYYAYETCERIKRQVSQYSRVYYPDEEDMAAGLTFRTQLREISHIRQEIRLQNYGVAPPLLRSQDGRDEASGEPSESELEELNDWLPTDEEVSQWRRDKVQFLTKGFARFQWVAQFYYHQIPVFKILIDATDIPQGDAVSAVYVDEIVTGNGFLNFLRAVVTAKDIKANDGQFFPSFMRRLTEKDRTVEKYLDDTYGEVRAPLYLKAQEIREHQIFSNPTAQRLYDAPRKHLVDLHEKFSSRRTRYLIWAIANDGALIIGKELGFKIDGRIEKCGHPSITGFKPARVAGEIHKGRGGGWEINSKSGRYSGAYLNLPDLLQNVLYKFRQFFPNDEFQLQAATAQAEPVVSQSPNNDAHVVNIGHGLPPEPDSSAENMSGPTQGA